MRLQTFTYRWYKRDYRLEIQFCGTLAKNDFSFVCIENYCSRRVYVWIHRCVMNRKCIVRYCTKRPPIFWIAKSIETALRWPFDLILSLRKLNFSTSFYCHFVKQRRLGGFSFFDEKVVRNLFSKPFFKRSKKLRPAYEFFLRYG